MNLWIEKAGHPEDSWTPGEAPGPELAVSLKQLGEPAIEEKHQQLCVPGSHFLDLLAKNQSTDFHLQVLW